MLAIDIHDAIAWRKESSMRQRLGEEIRHVIRALHKRDGYLQRLYALPEKNWCGRDALGCTRSRSRTCCPWRAKRVAESRRRAPRDAPRGRCLLGGLGSGEYLRLARGEGDGRLMLLRGPSTI
eukprot:4048089-Pleurochrysis_carterae.AAC.4